MDVTRRLLVSKALVYNLTRFVSSKTMTTAILPLSALPGPLPLPGFGTALRAARKGAFNGAMHEYFQQNFIQYGSIFKEELAGQIFVCLHDPKDIQQLLKHEGEYPERTAIEAWTMVRDEIQEVKGIVSSEGETWQRLRSSVNQPLMRPRTVASYADDFRQVADDMVARLSRIRGADHVVPNIQKELFKWSFESSCLILLERRLGVLGDKVSPEALEFITTIIDMLSQTEKLLLLPPKIAKALHLPVWSSYTEKWRTLFRLGKKYVDEVVADMAAKQERGETPDELIASMLAAGNLTIKELYANMIDIMGAAVDTTSNAACFTLDLLSRNPHVQDKLYQEIRCASGSDSMTLTYENVQKMPYLKAVVKETLRMYPVAPILGRILKKDMVLHGYNLPAGAVLAVMTYTMGHDPTLFRDPENFRPERWLRNQKEIEDIHPVASLPFGFGPRACIGRRVAELELYLLIATILKRFRLVATTTEPIRTEMKILLRQSTEPKIRFLERQNKFGE